MPADHRRGRRFLLGRRRDRGFSSIPSYGQLVFGERRSMWESALHFTGPLFLFGAVYVALTEFHTPPMRPSVFLGVVFCLTVLAYVAELSTCNPLTVTAAVLTGCANQYQ